MYKIKQAGLSFCDELKIRRHYSKPGLKGGEVKQCLTQV